jgi:hypothetical protein
VLVDQEEPVHARVQIVSTLPRPFRDHPKASRALIDVIGGQPGFRGIHLLMQIGSRQGLLLTLWDSLHDAEAAPARTQAVLGPRPFPLAVDEVYKVWDRPRGPAALEEATVAQLLWFDGPRSAAQLEAARRAGEERIKPALEDVPGFAGGYVLGRSRDLAMVVVQLATSAEALDQIAEVVFGTALLPGEDPALLTGPDRVEVYRLDGQSLITAPVA